MKTVPSSLQAHLDARATTLCRCWKLTRKDGTVMGFTDHDLPLSFDGVTFEAASALNATALEAGPDLSVPNHDVQGALRSSAITEGDIAAGRYDDAVVEVLLVNWADVSQRLLLFKGSLGEIRCGSLGFTAEVRGLAHRLQHPVGRVFQFGCDAVLGDARCAVNLELAAFKGTGSVTAAQDRRRFTASGLGSFAAKWFDNGQISWTTGLNAGLKGRVKSSGSGTGAALALWEPMPAAIAAGDAFTVTAGCDKRFSTCKAKFSNALNYRGHPHMPGNDWVIATPKAGEVNDGGRRG